MHIILKIAGFLFLLLGIIFTLKPELLDKFPASITPYEIIEKRVKWGLLMGLGIFVLYQTDWTSWRLIATALLATLTLGIIIARLTGFVLDGFFIKQLWWLLIELVVLLLFGFLHWKQRT
ncbi:DUF4345 family protein [Sphingobacterium paludis]|uniref:DUF4345 domain-containing protein n=1 Tax=Sphingobacterium paludis TaxID=1476465 RepID=A0A4R7CUZ2_9SPHI|nr:hypothetical protein [Sphingobacterium paludis]TDS12273.1 hypothetical protein B0I21_106130 [Sphingobacterium paludis]